MQNVTKSIEESCKLFVIPLLHQFHEIITVDGSLVIQANHNVAQHSLNLYFHILNYVSFIDVVLRRHIIIQSFEFLKSQVLYGVLNLPY